MDKEEFFDPEKVRQAGSMEFIDVLWLEYSALFPTEDDCLAELYRIAQIELQCRYCQSQNLEVTVNRRTGSCADCRKETWFTADTFLAHIKKPVARLAAIWLLAKGAVLKSLSFAKLVDISQSSAYSILKWARATIEANFPGNADLVDSSLFSSVFGKRSFFTPAKQHPRSEQVEIERIEAEKEQQLSEWIETGEVLSLEEDEVLKLIEEANSVRVETIIQRTSLPVGKVSGILCMLELSNLVQRLPGDQYIRVKAIRQRQPAPLKQELIDAIAAFHTFVRNSYGAISRRYLQNYLAAFWCYRASCQFSHREVLQTCFSAIQNTELKLRTYMTPRLVRLPGLLAA